MVWTRFMDMHSGGGQKGEFSFYFIEAAVEEAKVVFFNRFGSSPDRVSCTCCGADYSIRESESLEQASAYDRGCDYNDGGYVERPSRKHRTNKYETLDQFRKRGDILIICSADIAEAERVGEIPEQGYVWKD